MYYPYYYNFESLIFILPALIFALWAQYRVNSTYKKYAQVRSGRGLTGHDVARNILDQNGLYHVAIQQVRGHLSDHYDPRANVVRLSPEVYGSSSISAIGIAAHECGHAIQHATDYGPIRLRSAIIPVTNIGSTLAIPILIVGYLFSFQPLVWVGILGYSLMVVFQLVTLPVEFNASSRAMAVIEQNHYLEGGEVAGARKVLSAAALTYVAALASSIAQLLRLVMIFGGRRRN